MSKLTDKQLTILNAAARRPTGLLLPLTKSLSLNGGAAAAVLKSLLKRGLAEERAATAGEPCWRTSRDGRDQTLVLTPAGAEAIGVKQTEGKTSPKAGPAKRVRKSTKKAALIDMLEAGGGITVAAISKKLGWQPHTTRAALTRLRQEGNVLERIPVAEGGKAARYRITVAGQ